MKLGEFLERSEKLEGYRVGEELINLHEEGFSPSEILRLNQNENLFIPKEFLQDLLQAISGELDIRYYPVVQRARLEEAVADYLDVSRSQIVLGSGGDNIIELTLESILRTGDEVIALTPTFSMYPRTAELIGAKYIGVDIAKDFSIDVEEILNLINDKTKIIVLCNPNNPTANHFKKAALLELIEEFPGLILIDEAYAEFGEYSLVDKTENYDNLLILRTFSKAFGMAGLRLGYGVTNKRLSTIFNEKYQSPYPLSEIVMKMGESILKERSIISDYIKEVKKERLWLEGELNKIDGVKAFPSSTNFILMNLTREYQEVYQALFKKGILIRKIGEVPGYNNCIRVSIAPRPMLTRFIDALGEVMK
jgi:histidinol-phosphate aminotransferase